jgi:hypothetical protein
VTGVYAAKTDVGSDRSRAEIERTLQRYGARGFMYGWDEQKAVLGFVVHDRQVRFELPMPDRKAKEFWRTPARNTLRSPSAAEAAYDQAVRQRWRSLALVIKAKLEAVQAGIVEFDQEFLAHIVIGGRTVGDVLVPQLQAAIEADQPPALLPGGTR